MYVLQTQRYSVFYNICVLMFMFYTVCYFTGIVYAVLRQMYMLFIDNKESVCRSESLLLPNVSILFILFNTLTASVMKRLNAA